jgi:acyl carrier protein
LIEEFGMDADKTTSLDERVRKLLAESFQISPEEISQDLKFGDIPEWDSLGHMEVMMRLEEQFGMEVSTEGIAELVSVQAICRYLAEAKDA